jgi:transposase
MGNDANHAPTAVASDEQPCEAPRQQAELFSAEQVSMRPSAAEPAAGGPADPRIGARLRVPNRGQIVWGRIDLDAQLPEEHPARSIWSVVERLDLSALYDQVASRDAVPGTPAIDPKMLLAIWILATSEGEASAREIARLCKLHAAYRWLCGGVEVGHHTLSDFRSQQGKVFNDLITQVIAVLMKQELLDLSRTAQDGTRVRASAGTGSFRRKQTLQALVVEARAHLDAITKEAGDPANNARRGLARRRAAQDRLNRIEAALAEIPGIEETKKRSGAKDTTARASTTDPEARVMKMGDGGFRPAYNVQFATTADEARVIVGVEVTNIGSDHGRVSSMIDQIERRTGCKPAEHLVDGGFNDYESIEATAEKGVTFVGPVSKPRKGDTRDPHAPRDSDSEAVAEWRQRMATPETKEVYKQRAATAETVNADAKQHRGLDQLPVRGLTKVLASASLFVLTYDILRLIALGG